VTALFGLALSVASVALPRLSILPGGYPRVLSMPEFEVPAMGTGLFFVHALGEELSQLVLYHGLGESIDNARRADVVFLGNSRLQLGFDGDVLSEEAARSDVGVFSLGSGHRERANFGLDVLRRHDLRPEIVVVSGGPFVFDDRYSMIAQEAMAMTRFDAAKKWLEVTGGFNLQLRLHRLLPKLDFFDHELHAGWVHYRSSRDGWWRPALLPDEHRNDIGPAAEPSIEPGTLQRIARFRDALAERGSLLFLTAVPWDETNTLHIGLANRRLGVPGIVPETEGLSSVDGSHLDRDSAKRLSRRFWARFVEHPVVRARLFRDGAPSSERARRTSPGSR
jgi:hypothetical protein